MNYYNKLRVHYTIKSSHLKYWKHNNHFHDHEVNHIEWILNVHRWPNTGFRSIQLEFWMYTDDQITDLSQFRKKFAKEIYIHRYALKLHRFHTNTSYKNLYISRNMHTVHTFCCVLSWFLVPNNFCPYRSALLHSHLDNDMIAAAPEKQPWRIWELKITHKFTTNW